MGIGKVDPNFPIFYENVKGVAEREKEINVKHQQALKG